MGVIVRDKSFGAWLKHHRRERNLTQWDVADLVNVEGVDQPYISQIERGKIGRPSEERVRAFARAVGGDEEEALEAAGWQRIVVVPGGTQVRIVGRIPADSLRWMELEGESVQTVSVAPEFLVGARSPFALEVSGDCLRSIGIYHGDAVVFDTPISEPPRDRQLVAIRVGDEVTLKRWCVTGDGVELRDGDEAVVHHVRADDDLEVIGLYLTFVPRSER